MRLFCLCSLLCSLRHTAARSRKEQQKKKAGSGRAVGEHYRNQLLVSTDRYCVG